MLGEPRGPACRVPRRSRALHQDAAEVKLISPDADAQTQPFYFKDGAPNIEETQTDEQGAGGYLNLPINKVIRLEMHRATTDELIGTTSFRARAGAIVYVPLGPTEN